MMRSPTTSGAVRSLTVFILAIAGEPGMAAGQSGDSVTPSPALTEAQEGFTGPDAVVNQLEDDGNEKADLLDRNLLDEWEAVKDVVYDSIGLQFGADYNVLAYGATDSIGEDTSVTGVGRVFGSWELIGQGTPDVGSVVFKIEHRHAITDVAGTGFGGELGYAGLISSVFNDQGFRTTNLYWRQGAFGGRAVSYLGFVDVTDYVDIYALASPWTSFANLAFATGTTTIGGLPDGAFGVMAGGFLTSNLYAVASIVDANADPTDVFGGFESFFGDFETFKTLEIGVTSGGERLFIDNLHVTFWQIDEHADGTAPSGWGVSASVTGAIADRWLPFLRGGWASEGGSLSEASVSAGVGYQPEPGGNVLGVGLNWSRPNADTFGLDLDDQFTGELFYRVQLTENVQLTPSVQLLGNPALNPENDFIALFGLRGRIAF